MCQGPVYSTTLYSSYVVKDHAKSCIVIGCAGSVCQTSFSVLLYCAVCPGSVLVLLVSKTVEIMQYYVLLLEAHLQLCRMV